jgi:hypothetical protein
MHNPRMLRAWLLVAAACHGRDTPESDDSDPSADSDGDGYSTDDCDDDDASVNPGVDEVCDDGKDNDCDLEIDEGTLYYYDRDGDGFGTDMISAERCGESELWVTNAADCDDFDAAASPDYTELCNGKDDDCDAEIDEDCVALEPEECSNEVDDNGDGTIDCRDPTCACVIECLDQNLPDPQDNMLVNAGFEDLKGGPVTTKAVPTTEGIWMGDWSGRALSNATVSAHRGTAMARFYGTSPVEKMAVGGETRTELYNLGDVTGYAGRNLCLAGYFTRVPGDEHTDTAFFLRLAVYAGAAGEYGTHDETLYEDCGTPKNPNCQSTIVYATKPLEWIPAVTTVAIPNLAGPLTAAIVVGAIEDVTDDPDVPEFDGHYGDDFWLWVP